MNPVLIDTNAYVAFKRGDSTALEILQRTPAIGISCVVLGELCSGFAVGTREAENRRELSQFLALPKVALLPVDEDTAGRFVELYRQLRDAGTPVPTNDLWIAAMALQHAATFFRSTSTSATS